MVMPTKTLLQGCAYRPSWLQKPPKQRYTLPHLQGHYGLVGIYRKQQQEGSASEANTVV